jgi:hypothetical protein
VHVSDVININLILSLLKINTGGKDNLASAVTQMHARTTTHKVCSHSFSRYNVLSCSFTGEKLFTISASRRKGKLPEECIDMLSQPNYTTAVDSHFRFLNHVYCTFTNKVFCLMATSGGLPNILKYSVALQIARNVRDFLMSLSGVSRHKVTFYFYRISWLKQLYYHSISWRIWVLKLWQ